MKVSRGAGVEHSARRRSARDRDDQRVLDQRRQAGSVWVVTSVERGDPEDVVCNQKRAAPTQADAPGVDEIGIRDEGVSGRSETRFVW
jgi:hypothetical protein